jgi:hypothetical protein
MHGMGGRTVPKWWRYDLRVISKIVPDILILEIGTNYLSLSPPEAVGSDIEDLVRLLIDKYAVNTVVLCQVTPRVTRENSTFICWTHRGFCNPAVTPFLPDGAHLIHTVQYTFYRSYRGAIMHALATLQHGTCSTWIVISLYNKPWFTWENLYVYTNVVV